MASLFRRCVTAVLIASYLVAGLAGPAHVHASQTSDHGVRAHVHVDWLGRLLFVGGEAGDHDETCDHHGHHHHGDGHHHSHDVPVERPSPASSDDGEHDSTCIYLADESGLLARGPLGNEPDAGKLLASVFDLLAVSDESVLIYRPDRYYSPPVLPISGLDWTLTLRTLRI